MLEHIAYCPILHTRVSETKALRQLPTASKDRIFPVFVASPWPNAKHLSKTWEKVTEAFGPRRFAIDLDPLKRHSGTGKPAAAEFDELFDPTDGFENYYAEISNIPGAVPVLQLTQHPGESHVPEQALRAEALDRGLIVRIQYGRTSEPTTVIRKIHELATDVSFVIDAGWSTDLLSLELWSSGLIQEISNLDDHAEIVVSGSSFPDEFSKIKLRAEIPVKERFLYSNLVRRHNAATLVYGDWGSTRPPAEPKPMNIVPRIDLPTSNEWISFRQSEGESYKDIALRATQDARWPADMSIWGTYIISCTADNLPGSIRDPKTAAAARINIHLHRQSNFELPGNVGDGEEPYTDE